MALGEYRGPLSVRACIKYVTAYMDKLDREEIYKVYVSEHLRAIVGSGISYYETAYSSEPEDFDAEKVIDEVLAEIGFGEDDEA